METFAHVYPDTKLIMMLPSHYHTFRSSPGTKDFLNVHYFFVSEFGGHSSWYFSTFFPCCQPL
jgi:hypothetical protein